MTPNDSNADEGKCVRINSGVFDPSWSDGGIGGDESIVASIFAIGGKFANGLESGMNGLDGWHGAASRHAYFIRNPSKTQVLFDNCVGFLRRFADVMPFSSRRIQ